jgi:hypothetical protein
MAFAGLAAELLVEADSMGLGEADFAAIVEALAERSRTRL